MIIDNKCIGAEPLAYHDGAVVSNPEARARRDKTMKGWKKLMRADPAETASRTKAIIKNTYRTLMTRGMKGCYVYATDPALRDHLGSRLHDRQGQR